MARYKTGKDLKHANDERKKWFEIYIFNTLVLSTDKLSF